MTALGAFNPLDAYCEYCHAPASQKCHDRRWVPARRPHMARVKLARVLAAHADPALDPFFPVLCSCGVCGVPRLPQRHRVVDAIAGRLSAGEGADEVAADHLVSADAVRAVREWMIKWPGAWT